MQFHRSKKSVALFVPELVELSIQTVPPNRIQATSKSDDESSASLYECKRVVCLMMPLLLRFEFGDDVASFKWHFNELLFKWSSCNFLSRSFSSLFCLRNFARRFLNQTWKQQKKQRVNILIFFLLHTPSTSKLLLLVNWNTKRTRILHCSILLKMGY